MSENLPPVSWVLAANNPWGVPVLDVRPVTLALKSSSSDPTHTANALSFANEDGLCFADADLPAEPVVTLKLHYKIDRHLPDGVLFKPNAMEHKWALFLHRGRILFVRSWLRQVVAAADVRIDGDHVELMALRGNLVALDEPPPLASRAVDFLIRSHALGLVHPAPVPEEVQDDNDSMALFCFSLFGNLAVVAAPNELPQKVPDEVLRTDSLLHIAAARGDTEAVTAHLDAGVPLDLLARNGLTPLHWALHRPDTTMMAFLLDRGAPVNVRSQGEVTPLMTAVEQGSVEKVELLLDRGADPNAADKRGFTALHRAAEMGLLNLARLLLRRGARPHPEAEGQTPLSLAEGRKAVLIAELLKAWKA